MSESHGAVLSTRRGVFASAAGAALLVGHVARLLLGKMCYVAGIKQ
jgi:hypothetical protein